MAMKRKRSGGNQFAFGNKRRRRFSAKRGVRRRGRRTCTYTSAQDGRPRAVGFRNKKISRSSWKSALWRDTRFKTHYRSILDRVSTVAMPTDTRSAVFAFSPVHGDLAFWSVNGGLQPINVGENIPEFRDDLTIRGGMGSITFTNLDNADPVRVKLYLVWTIASPDFSVIPADQSVITLSAQSIDPTVLPDFEKVGKVLRGYDILLLPGQRPVTFWQRMPVQKLDQAVFQTSGGKRYWWFYFASQVSNIDSVNNTLRVQFGHNLSFCGDVSETFPPALLAASAASANASVNTAVSSLVTNGRPGSSITPGLVRPST